MKKRSGIGFLPQNQAQKLRVELARKIALFVGSAENRATDIRGLTLHRRTTPTAPCSATYEPGVTVIAQGRKRVELGRNVFIYDASRFLLTSVDLPVVSRVIEASREAPCLAMSLKLEMPVIREVLSQEELEGAEPPSSTPGMAVGETTAEFLSACCRLVDLLNAASAAFEVGYESASQFNREYSRFFGRPPMRDIRSLRSPSAPRLETAGIR